MGPVGLTFTSFGAQARIAVGNRHTSGCLAACSRTYSPVRVQNHYLKQKNAARAHFCFNGGSCRTRTYDQTVMSGRL